MNETDSKIIERHDPKVRRRAAIQLKVTRAIIVALRAAGYELRGDDGEGSPTKWSATDDEIVEHLFGVDEAHLITRINGRTSSAFLVMGNDGWDILSDYGTSLSPVLDPILEWVAKEESGVPYIGKRITKHFCGGTWYGTITKVSAKSILVCQEVTGDIINLRLGTLGLELTDLPSQF